MQCYYSLPIFTLKALAPQVLAEQLTLSQPGGQIMPTTELRAPFPPPGFSDLATALYRFQSLSSANLFMLDPASYNQELTI